jgi:hypothetical protein
MSILGEDLFDTALHAWHRKDLLNARPISGIYREESFDHTCQFRRIDWGHLLIGAFSHFLKELIHVLSLKRSTQGSHFIEDATKGPHITLEIVGLVPPHFW